MAGYAFHTGVLAALQDAGLDCRRADREHLRRRRAGHRRCCRPAWPPADHYAHTLGRPLSDHAEALVARLRRGPGDGGELADPALPLRRRAHRPA
ncbi:MAG: hypothetical protein R2749_04565 [Acidimicrobiales bacterium]